MKLETQNFRGVYKKIPTKTNFLLNVKMGAFIFP